MVIEAGVGGEPRCAPNAATIVPMAATRAASTIATALIHVLRFEFVVFCWGQLGRITTVHPGEALNMAS
jgi:hypothetical protein